MRFIYELTRSTKKGHSIRGGNEMISSNDRICPYIRAELTNHLRKLSKEMAVKHMSPEHIMFSDQNTCHIGVIICPPTRRRNDAPNWYPTVKALIDGLTDAGVFEDDNDKVIKSTTFIPGPKTENKKYRFEIVIRKGVDDSWLT